MIKVNPASGSLPTLMGLAGAESKQGSKIEPVLLIHGTFANKHSDDEGVLHWWRPGSKFCLQLDVLFQEEGAAARCWATIATTFAWTGDNSELARRKAGRALADQLTALEEDNGTARYHLIAHSHGGNVILNALSELPRNPTKLGAVVFMGTPVLRFRHSELLHPRWIAIPLYIIALAGGIWALPYFGNIVSFFWISFVLLPIFYAMLAEFFQLGSLAGNLQYPQYGSGCPRAFVFPSDEAIDSFTLAQEIERNPGRFIDQFIRSRPRSCGAVDEHRHHDGCDDQKAPLFAVKPTPVAPLEDLLSQIRRTGAYWLLFSSVPTEHLSGVERIFAQFRMQQLPDSAPLLAKVPIFVLLLCATLPSLIMAILVAIYSFTTRAASTFVAAIILGFAKILGLFVLPALIRKAIFGEDQGHFLEMRDLPPGVSVCETITDDGEAARLSQQFGQDVGQAIRDAIANGDAFAIKSRVTDALTNTRLAHSHYYTSQEIKQKIARLIATLPQPQPPPRLRQKLVLPWELWGHGFNAAPTEHATSKTSDRRG